MIIPDVNILIHAYDSGFAHHRAAKEWWEEVLTAGHPVGLAWAATLGFMRIATHRGVLSKPLPVGDAVNLARSWLEQPGVRVVVPGDRHGEILFRLLEEAGTAGNLTTDAHLAALAIEYRAEIATTDSDFARFPGLSWSNPISRKRRRG